MPFNSIDYAIFLPIVFILYWFVAYKNLRIQNALVLASSMLFYGWWDWRFLVLVWISTIVDFSVGLCLQGQNNQAKRKLLLWTSITTNLGLLGLFKYYNFFIDSFTTAFSFFGADIKADSLNIILPVGISFYTFQTLSYTIDVYKQNIKPTKDFIVFAAFVGFFPQLVAGPIERATNLLPQFMTKRNFEYTKAVDGLRQILWGFFKKIVIADSCAIYANQIFNNSDNFSGSTLVLGALFFSFQIYCDFSGYSDIAIGSAKLFGFNLMKNFAFPYFSRDIAEFWRRWHISLSTWFRDYLYIPLGGSKAGTWRKIQNTFIIFIVTGFWHGANWTYIVWGMVNAIYFLPLLLLNRNRNNLGIVGQGQYLPSIRECLSMLITFTLVSLAWIFFRAENIGHAMRYLSVIFSRSLFTIPSFTDRRFALVSLILVMIFLIVEWFGRKKSYAIAHIGSNWFKPMRWAFYYILITAIFIFSDSGQQFIYFQF